MGRILLAFRINLIRRKTMRMLLLSLFGISILVVAGAFYLTRKDSGGGMLGREIDHYWEVGEFDFTDQHGKRYSSEALKGKVWLANFMFTSCPAECPVLTRQLDLVRQKLGPRNDVAYVSFSVDPQTDTPDRLKAYSEAYGSDPNWSLLTGEVEVMTEVIRSQFLQPLTREVDGDDPENNTIYHSNLILVIDGEGSVRYYYDGLDPRAATSLSRVVEVLLEESRPG